MTELELPLELHDGFGSAVLSGGEWPALNSLAGFVAAAVARSR